MIPGYEGPTTPGPAHSSNDTIELGIGDRQRLADPTAPASAYDCESRPVLAAPENSQLGSERTARIDFVCNVTLALIALGFVIAFFWPRWDQDAYAPPAASTLPLVNKTATLPESSGAPLRIANAFDATEVFEFPYGTSESEARDAISELLLARARERQAQRPRGHGAPFEQSAVLVNRRLDN